MRKSILPLLPLVALACTSASSATHTPKRNLARLEAAQPAGPPVSCIETHRIKTSHVLNDRTIDFEMIDGRTYRNTLPYECPSLGYDEGFAYETSINRLCAVDTITVMQQIGGLHRGASCGLGEFQPVKFAKK